MSGKPVDKESLRKAIESLHEIVVDMPRTEEKKRLLDILQRMTEELLDIT